MKALLLVLALVVPAFAEEPHHHHGESAEVDAFISSWKMPDNRAVSCCSKVDTYATEAKKVGGRWYARQRETGDWIPVPPQKIETERDSPDGRNYVAMSPNGNIYCFILGGGA
jgi:hypothetical protein